MVKKQFNLIQIRNDDFRESCSLILAITAAIFLIPFAVLDAINGNYLLSAGIGTLVLVFLFLVWKIKNNHYNQKYALVLVLPILITVLCLAFHYLGIKGGLWAYPGIIVFYMVLSEKIAWLANALLIAVISFESFTLLPIKLAIRVVATLTVASFFIAVFVNIIMQQQARLSVLAKTDALTGLLDRTTMKQELHRLINQAERSSLPIAMIQADLDFFKKVNDDFGHAAGDQTLQAFAKLMLLRTRKTDEVFRLGGEEFMILLFNTDIEGASALAEELRGAVSDSVHIKTTASFGVSTHFKDEDAEKWMSRTDALLYQAKEMGRNRVVIQ